MNLNLPSPNGTSHEARAASWPHHNTAHLLSCAGEYGLEGPVDPPARVPRPVATIAESGPPKAVVVWPFGVLFTYFTGMIMENVWSSLNGQSR
jgi:hypothetical protein